MPHMQRLSLAGAWPKSPILVGCDLARSTSIKDCVRKYIPPASCQYLPPVTVSPIQFLTRSPSSVIFVGTSDVGNNRRLMYTDRAPLLEF